MASPRVEKLAREIVAREGGFVNDPDDPGGATKHGVTIGTLRALGLDLTGDGAVDVADVRAVTPEVATRLFIDEYFRKPGIDRLPEGLQDSVFDMQVNAGANAGHILQRLLRALGHADVVPDGVIGPRTAAAAHTAWSLHGEGLRDAYGIERRNYYLALADRRPALRKFARRRDGGKGGWIVRAEEFIAERWHLTAAAWQERVAGWG